MLTQVAQYVEYTRVYLLENHLLSTHECTWKPRQFVTVLIGH